MFSIVLACVLSQATIVCPTVLTGHSARRWGILWKWTMTVLNETQRQHLTRGYVCPANKRCLLCTESQGTRHNERVEWVTGMVFTLVMCWLKCALCECIRTSAAVQYFVLFSSLCRSYICPPPFRLLHIIQLLKILCMRTVPHYQRDTVSVFVSHRERNVAISNIRYTRTCWRWWASISQCKLKCWQSVLKYCISISIHGRRSYYCVIDMTMIDLNGCTFSFSW